MDEEVTFDKISSVEKTLFSLGIYTYVTSSSVRHSPATFPAGEGSFAPPRGGAVRVLNPFYKYPFIKLRLLNRIAKGVKVRPRLLFDLYCFTNRLFELVSQVQKFARWMRLI